jgi:hypothetical protein
MGATGELAVWFVYGLVMLAWWALKYSFLGLVFIGTALFTADCSVVEPYRINSVERLPQQLGKRSSTHGLHGSMSSQTATKTRTSAVMETEDIRR